MRVSFFRKHRKRVDIDVIHKCPPCAVAEALNVLKRDRPRDHCDYAKDVRMDATSERCWLHELGAFPSHWTGEPSEEQSWTPSRAGI